MNNDFLDPINSEGMPKLADSAFALDFLLSAKNGVRNCAYAIAETATPEARTVLRRQLADSLALHDEISHLMMARGWLYPYQPHEQFQLDLTSSDTTVKIAQMQLFPDDTSRQGTFATPNR